jgi:hypothetical protein
MLLDKTKDWTTIDAYVTRKPSRLALFLARAGWLWLEWRAAAPVRAARRDKARIAAAVQDLPESVRRDIGLM